MEKFCKSATNITHFIHVNETDFGNVTEQVFIFELGSMHVLNLKSSIYDILNVFFLE